MAEQIVGEYLGVFTKVLVNTWEGIMTLKG